MRGGAYAVESLGRHGVVLFQGIQGEKGMTYQFAKGEHNGPPDTLTPVYFGYT